MATDFKLDRGGVRQLLKSPAIRRPVHDAAEDIAARLGLDPDVEVVVDDYTTDRVASSVTIKHPAGLLWEVRDGVLSRAAAAAGLEVTSKA